MSADCCEIAQVYEYLRKHLGKGTNCKSLAKQWIRDFQELNKECAERPELPAPTVSQSYKNRFTDIWPSEHRVLLSGCSDYINADRCEPQHSGEAELILTQAPMRNTVLDFVRMLLEQKVGLVLCLQPCCPEEEACYMNFVDFDLGEQLYRMDSARVKSLSFGKLQAELYRCKVQAKEVEHEFPLLKVLNWVDRSIPDSLDDLAELLRFAYSIAIQDHPILIHCLAGVGRTGVAAVGLRLLESQRRGCGAVAEVRPILSQLRSCRRKLVPSLQQFIGLQVLRTKLLMLGKCK